MEQKVIRSNILLPEIEASYRNEYTEYARRNLRCSDAGCACDEGEKCEREIFYDMTIPEKKTLLSSGTLVLFDDGRIHEADIRRRLRLLFDSPERELKDEEILLNGRPVSGKIDNTVKFAKIKEALLKCLEEAKMPLTTVMSEDFGVNDPVVELKSTNEFSYQMMARDGKISQSYYDQVQEYLFISKKQIAIVLIKNRNSSGDEKGVLPFLEFVVLSDPSRQQIIRAGLKTTAECIEKKILPPRPFLMESTKCSYCRFKFSCWGEAMKKKEAVIEIKDDLPAPGQEMVESALKIFAATNAQIKALEDEQEQAKSVLLRFFRATKLPETQVQDIKATYSVSMRSFLDGVKLLEKVGPAKYATMAKPERKLIEQAIADRVIDAKVLEDITVPGKAQENLRVTKIKEMSERVKECKHEYPTSNDGKVGSCVFCGKFKEKESVNDKGNIGSKKDPEVRKNPARGKSKKRAGNGVPERSGLLPARSGRAGSKKKGRAAQAV